MYQRRHTAIGTRRDRAQLLQLATTDDGMGGQVPLTANGWQIVAEPWIGVTALDERTHESLAARQITARHAYHVDMRYRTGVQPSMRLRWRDTTMEIHSVVDDNGRKQRLILLCSEVQ